MCRTLKGCFLLALGLVVAVVGTADASIMDFRMLINGDASPVQFLANGTYSLTIEARVTDNLIGPSSNIPGGLTSATVNLGDSGNQLTFAEAVDGFGSPNGKWDNTANANFDTFFPGVLNLNGFDVFGQLGAINPPLAFGDQALIGDGAFATIFTGNFDVTGQSPTILGLEAKLAEQTVAGFSGAIVAVAPDVVNGTSILINVPEPASLALAGFALLSVLATRRRT